MAIIQWALTHQVNPVVSPCNTAPAFTVNATLVAQTDAGGLMYVVRVCDDDGVGRDVLAATGVNRFIGAGWHIGQHRFTLDCDPACIVKGAQGSSGEQIAEIYCNAEERGTLVFAWEVDSWPPTTVTCQQSDDEPVDDESSGGSGESEEDSGSSHGSSMGSHVRDVMLAWVRTPDVPVTGIKVTLPAALPEYQIIPDEIDFKVVPLQVGAAGQRLDQPLRVRWTLKPRTLDRLTKFDGRFVRHDPDSHRWEVVKEFEMADGVLTFTADGGGLFGVAAGSRYRRYEGFSSHPRMGGATPRDKP